MQAVGRGDRVGVDEPGVAGLFDEVDAGGANVVGDALAFMEVGGDPPGVGQGGGEVDLGPRPAQTNASRNSSPSTRRAARASVRTGAGPLLKAVPPTLPRSMSVTSAPSSAACRAPTHQRGRLR